MGRSARIEKRRPSGRLFCVFLQGGKPLKTQAKSGRKGEQFGEKGVNIMAVEKSVETVKNPLFKGISVVARRLWISSQRVIFCPKVMEMRQKGTGKPLRWAIK
ncbi:MAG: hypothetical protein J6B99_03545 [Oscillospiraceae bacterium]|nr:hypothetical protein [Oscillospiraceae bacterium]